LSETVVIIPFPPEKRIVSSKLALSVVVPSERVNVLAST
jgi:hypothetical protein